MRITTDHPASSYGVPVILTDGGQLMDTRTGIRAIRGHFRLSRPQLASALGVSPRTVEAWEQGKDAPAARRLYDLASLVDSQKQEIHT